MKEDMEKEIIDIFKKILNKELDHFPRCFWTGEGGRERANIISKYLIEEIFGFGEYEVLNVLAYKHFTENKLSGMLKIVYRDCVYNVVNSVYPNKYKPWELNMTPRYFWKNRVNRIYAIIWLLEKENIKFDEIDKKLTRKMLLQNRLTGLLDIYNGNMKKLKKDTLPVLEQKNKKQAD